jgi:hypothetical protein
MIPEALIENESYRKSGSLSRSKISTSPIAFVNLVILDRCPTVEPLMKLNALAIYNNLQTRLYVYSDSTKGKKYSSLHRLCAEEVITPSFDRLCDTIF